MHQIVYHIFLGRFWYQSTVCDHWWEIAKHSDVIFISTGSHIQAMKEYPHNIPSTSIHNFSYTNLFRKESLAIANKLHSIVSSSSSSHNSVVVYRTPHIGITPFSNDCGISHKPYKKPLPIATHDKVSIYHWADIPLHTKIYVKTLKHVLKNKLLVMPTQNMMMEYWGCRNDYMHFRDDDERTPLLIEWQILHNLLLENRKNK